MIQTRMRSVSNGATILWRSNNLAIIARSKDHIVAVDR